jgi:hypothetical protein
MYVASKICEGLGNRFFQVAAMTWYAKKHGHKAVFVKTWMYTNSHPGPHGIEFYFPNLLILDEPEGSWSICEPPFSTNHTFIDIPKIEGNIYLLGYFQVAQYVDVPVPQVLVDPGFVIPHSYFLHVRRGDYLHEACTHHVVDLTLYMTRARGLFPSDATVIVCSDDIEWCKSTISGASVVFFDADDYATLRMMVHCDLGGICANSTFSWWGAYWGHVVDPSRLYTMPSVWGYTPIPPADDLLPPWASIIPVT